MENRYTVHLPDMVKDLKEFQKLGEMEGMLLEEAAVAKDALEKNHWILTAERSGLLRLAKMIGHLLWRMNFSPSRPKECFRAGKALAERSFTRILAFLRTIYR